jgi:hypothetical protein
MGASGNDIADIVLRKFDDLPKKAKPLHRGGGAQEWIPLCGIVAEGWPPWWEGCVMGIRLTFILEKESLTCLAVA